MAARRTVNPQAWVRVSHSSPQKDSQNNLMKKCTECKSVKSESDFHLSLNTKDGRHTQCMSCRRGKTSRYSRYQRTRVLNKLGNRCSSINCRWKNPDGTYGCLDLRAIQIDHKNGGGRKELKTMSGFKYYAMLNRMSIDELKSKYQLLCANCNWIKKFEHNEK